MKHFLPRNAVTLSLPATSEPSTSTVYADANDRMRHLRNIERLAQEMERPAGDVEPLYEDVLARMKATASIPDYLPILVSKRVKYLLDN